MTTREVKIYQDMTKLFLAGVAAVALLATASTAISAPPKAQGPPTGIGGKVPPMGPLGCAVGQIPRSDDVGGWTCDNEDWNELENVPADIADGDDDTNAATICATAQFLDGDGNCVAIPAAADLTAVLNRLADLEDLVPRYVFVTSTPAAAGGALGGLAGADQKCQELADNDSAIVPVGTYVAWLSTPEMHAWERIDIISGPYLRSNGSVMANNGVDLLDGTIDRPLRLNELGGDTNAIVWTGTQPNGDLAGADHCVSWSSQAGEGRVGSTASVGAAWTSLATDTCGADDVHIYCFQVLQ